MRGTWLAVVGLAPCFVAAAGCGGGRDNAIGQLSGTAGTGGEASGDTGGDTGAAGRGGDGMTTTPPPAPLARGCSDLFDPTQLVDYGFDISAEEWARIDYEFRNRDALAAAGVDYKTYHPIVFHYGSETVPDAMVRLKGESSWRQAVQQHGDKAKMQFVVSFEEVNGASKFHGLSKIVLDMPQNDETFLQERLAFTAAAELFGLPAPCANSARVTINGQFYGLYVNEEHVGGGFLKRVFPEAPHGDLFDGGYTPRTNELNPDTTKLKAFWAARDINAMAAVVDLETSVAEWAAEAMLNNADGYYGGKHNYYLYDYPGRGYRWLLDDGDATFAWLGRSDPHPIYWWVNRSTERVAGQHYVIVMGDPTWRAKYVEALRQMLARWDVGRLQGWIDAWSAQIADAVMNDPYRLDSMEVHREAIADTRQLVVDRASHIASFLACQDGTGATDDRDGDGFAWCNDCNDGNAAVNPGVAEICGNAIDDDCDSYVDTADGCP